MKVMVYCPLMPAEPRIQPATLDSILALDWPEPLEIVFGKQDRKRRRNDELEANRNITDKYNRARELTLSGGYDALLTVESDMIVPPLALKRLSKVEADVVYGLYVSRHGPHPWLLMSEITENVRGTKAMGETPAERSALLGEVVETAGVGMGCTLIHRHVLEAIPFRVTDQYIANDWYFAVDCVAQGFRQMHDCGVICGHIDGYKVLWPDVAQGYLAIGPQINVKELLAMAKGNYEVVRTIWMNKHVYPGEVVELPDEIAEVLLAKQVIKPAKRAKKDVEVNYDTDD